MEFSNRDSDKTTARSLLASQAGQAVTEYILILVVVVAMVLGGMYQLNTAFKVWANNYFGSYLACLLETGDLPSIGGTPGDSGLCNQLFKPFSPADGRPLLTASSNEPPPSSGGGGGGSRENSRSGSGGSAGPSQNLSGGSGRPFGGSSGFGASAAQGKGSGGKSDSTNTGNTGVSSSGGYTSDQKPPTEPKTKLDNGFAFENEKEGKQKRREASISRPPAGDSASSSRTIVHHKDRKKDKNQTDDSPMTFGNFLRLLIIAAIIVALVVFIGGQMLQVGKSME